MFIEYFLALVSLWRGNNWVEFLIERTKSVKHGLVSCKSKIWKFKISLLAATFVILSSGNNIKNLQFEFLSWSGSNHLTLW